MSKYVKGMMISAIESRLNGTRDYVVVDLSKLDGNANNAFRMNLRKSGIQLLAVKNALARNALAKSDVEAPKEVFNGPCSIAFGSTDIVELSKEITKWAKQIDAVQIRGGAVDGQSLTADGVKEWSKAKGRQETIAEIVGAIVSQGGLVAGALLGPGGIVAGQIKTKSEEEAA